MLLLHLSNTDIRNDSRILKELRALERLDNYERIGIGVELDERGAPNGKTPKANIVTLRLFTKILGWLPRAVRYALGMVELTFRIYFKVKTLKPTVVHCHDTFVLPAGTLIKLATGCKLVYDAHELESNKSGQSRVLSLATLIIEKLCWRKVDLLISVSESIISWYQSNIGPKESVLILNSPEIGFLAESSGSGSVSQRYFHNVYDIPDDKLVFVYLGLLTAGRGIEIALESFASPSIDAHLVLVGYGDLDSLVRKYCENHKNIHLHDPVPHDQVVALIGSADVGLCMVENISLSDYYCLPNKLFEYCFSGLNILASDLPEIRRVVDEYSLGVCCALNPDKVRESIQFLIDHRPARKNKDLSALGWEAQSKRLIDGYRKLLNMDVAIDSNQIRSHPG